MDSNYIFSNNIAANKPPPRTVQDLFTVQGGGLLPYIYLKKLTFSARR